MNDSPKTKVIEMTLITGRTWKQGAGMEIGRDSEEYTRAIAICEIGEADMKALDIREGDPVRLTSKVASIILRATKTEKPPYPGVIFVPMGIYVNHLMSYKTDTTGMPQFKGIKVQVEAAPGEAPPSIKDFIQEVYS